MYAFLVHQISVWSDKFWEFPSWWPLTSDDPESLFSLVLTELKYFPSGDLGWPWIILFLYVFLLNASFVPTKFIGQTFKMPPPWPPNSDSFLRSVMSSYLGFPSVQALSPPNFSPIRVRQTFKKYWRLTWWMTSDDIQLNQFFGFVPTKFRLDLTKFTQKRLPRPRWPPNSNNVMTSTMTFLRLRAAPDPI